MFKKKLVTLRNNQKERPSQILVILFLPGTNTEGVWTFLYSNCFAGDQKHESCSYKEYKHNIRMSALYASVTASASQIWFNHFFS